MYQSNEKKSASRLTSALTFVTQYMLQPSGKNQLDHSQQLPEEKSQLKRHISDMNENQSQSQSKNSPQDVYGSTPNHAQHPNQSQQGPFQNASMPIPINNTNNYVYPTANQNLDHPFANRQSNPFDRIAAYCENPPTDGISLFSHRVSII